MNFRGGGMLPVMLAEIFAGAKTRIIKGQPVGQPIEKGQDRSVLIEKPQAVGSFDDGQKTAGGENVPCMPQGIETFGDQHVFQTGEEDDEIKLAAGAELGES